MNIQQANAAQKAMVLWLSHPHELGKAPAKIELVGAFDLHGLHYYIFKYQKALWWKWFLGVCGGYEDESLEHCGHVFSEMHEYKQHTAEEEAIKMVEAIRAYWMEQARKHQ